MMFFGGFCSFFSCGSATPVAAPSLATVQLGTPSHTAANSAATVTIVATFTNAATFAVVSSDVTVTATDGGNQTCTATVSAATASGATITLTNCTGNGPVTASVNAGAITNSAAVASVASAASETITVQNTLPTIVSYAPGVPTSSVPASFTIVFSEAMTLPPGTLASYFVFGGTCGTKPSSAGSITLSADLKTATVPLTGSNCTTGTTLIVTLTNADLFSDLAGDFAATLAGDAFLITIP